MRDLKRCRESNLKVFILDTAAFLVALPLQIYDVELYTVPAVVDEVKDYESRTRLEFAAIVDRFHVEMPEDKYFKKAVEIAKRFKAMDKLSMADMQVLALALKLRDCGLKPIVVTDDYTLQRILTYIGIDFKPVKTIGIKSS